VLNREVSEVEGLRELGRRGEERAADYLRRQGYRILERNYQTREGEIDIVAHLGGTLVFVEVKTARSLSFGHPRGWVSRRKRAHLVRAALAYMMEKGDLETSCRFDVIAIVMKGKRVQLTHIPDAFPR
jgi:putative endonuclease